MTARMQLWLGVSYTYYTLNIVYICRSEEEGCTADESNAHPTGKLLPAAKPACLPRRTRRVCLFHLFHRCRGATDATTFLTGSDCSVMFGLFGAGNARTPEQGRTRTVNKYQGCVPCRSTVSGAKRLERWNEAERNETGGTPCKAFCLMSHLRLCGFAVTAPAARSVPPLPSPR